MSITYAPTTMLEALNSMLMSIGEAPVNRLDNPGVIDAVQAKAVLLEENRAVQSQGWHFNTRRRVTLFPQSFAPKYIYVPENTLSVDTVDEDQWTDVALHGDKLFDVVNNTYEFDRNLKVDLILLQPFENIPQQARHYITLRAARIFQIRTVGSGTLSDLTQNDEYRAHAALRQLENRRADWNAFTDNNLGARIRRRRP